MADKYILWVKMDSNGNCPDKNAGYRIIDRENAIAFLGLCGHKNPIKALDFLVDGTGGLINIKGKALCEYDENRL